MTLKLHLTAAATALFLAAAACGAPTSSNSAPTPAQAPANTPTATATASTPANTIAAASFSGRSDHITTGRASITGSEGAYKLTLAADFSLDGAPDPIVGFGKGGTYNPATKLGSLKNKTGAQTYDLPANFNPADVSEVYVWCEQFDVPLGVATLSN